MGGQRKDMPAGSTGPADDISDGLPGEVRPLFHNYDADTIDASRDAAWIILTVLSRGDWDQVGWLFRTYGWARIEAVVRDDIAGLQTLPRVVANFWSVVFWGRTLPPRPFRERWAATRRVSGVTRGDGR